MDPLPDGHACVSAEQGGIVTGLADLSVDAHVDVAALAKIFGRCVKTIERSVRRGELPPPIKLCGKRVWLAGVIREHLRARHEAALKLAGKREQRRQSEMERVAPWGAKDKVG